MATDKQTAGTPKPVYHSQLRDAVHALVVRQIAGMLDAADLLQLRELIDQRERTHNKDVIDAVARHTDTRALLITAQHEANTWQTRFVMLWNELSELVKLAEKVTADRHGLHTAEELAEKVRQAAELVAAAKPYVPNF